MAKYDNQFLVQYFKDLYALYALRRKLKESVRSTIAEIDTLKQGKYRNPTPEQPRKQETNSWGMLIGGGFFAALAMLSGMLLYINSENGAWIKILFLIVSLGVGTACFLAADSDRKIAKYKNEVAQTEYQQALDKYREISRKNEQCKQRIPVLQYRVVRYKENIHEIDELIQNAYRINIIPNQYRDFYTIVYLYDYFEGSRETDIAMALNTYVLEQIKDRLDRIIAQLSDIILNQYVIMDNQQKAMQAAQRQYTALENRLKCIEASNEERNVYLEMIESNTATMRYFATVDFLTK